jgi:hypothetical protein
MCGGPLRQREGIAKAKVGFCIDKPRVGEVSGQAERCKNAPIRAVSRRGPRLQPIGDVVAKRQRQD